MKNSTSPDLSITNLRKVLLAVIIFWFITFGLATLASGLWIKLFLDGFNYLSTLSDPKEASEEMLLSNLSFSPVIVVVSWILAFIAVVGLYITTIIVVVKIGSVNPEYRYVHQSTGKTLLIVGLFLSFLIIFGAFILDKQLKIALEQAKNEEDSQSSTDIIY